MNPSDIFLVMFRLTGSSKGSSWETHSRWDTYDQASEALIKTLPSMEGCDLKIRRRRIIT